MLGASTVTFKTGTTVNPRKPNTLHENGTIKEVGTASDDEYKYYTYFLSSLNLNFRSIHKIVSGFRK